MTRGSCPIRTMSRLSISSQVTAPTTRRGRFSKGCIPRYLRTNSMGGTLTKRAGQNAETSQCSRDGSRSSSTRSSRISATTRSLMRMMKPNCPVGTTLVHEIRNPKDQNQDSTMGCVNFVPTPRASRWHHVPDEPRRRGSQVGEDAPDVTDGYRWCQPNQELQNLGAQAHGGSIPLPLPPPRIPALAALAERRRASSSRVQRSPPSDNQFSNPLRLLRRDDERRGEQAASQTADERAPLHHWMISSARCSSDRGIVSPSALAVLRLITSSNFVGCSMGRSPGLAPLRILSTYTAAIRNMSERFAPYPMSPPASTHAERPKIVGSRCLTASLAMRLRSRKNSGDTQT